MVSEIEIAIYNKTYVYNNERLILINDFNNFASLVLFLNFNWFVFIEMRLQSFIESYYTNNA